MNDVSATSTDTDFIRLGLRDTRNGEIKPESLLAEWLNAIERSGLLSISPHPAN